MMWKEAKYYKYNLALFISYMRNTSKVIEIILFKERDGWSFSEALHAYRQLWEPMSDYFPMFKHKRPNSEVSFSCISRVKTPNDEEGQSKDS